MIILITQKPVVAGFQPPGFSRLPSSQRQEVTQAHWPEINPSWVNPDHFSSPLQFPHIPTAQLSLSTPYDLQGFRLADVGGW